MSAPPSVRHAVAVIGGATAGAEVAARLADHGCAVTVFEQNPRPYGKIEDGLPCWHVGLRNKEYETISAKLSRPGVHFVPLTKVGQDVDFGELCQDWGFSAVVLACGAWRDRKLPIDDADAWIDKGLIYQNPFIVWFNHKHEADYSGETFEAKDGALVVGGGLASIDVAKLLMLENTLAKLRERGIEIDLIELELKGIPKTLARHDLQFEDLGLEGCTIFYRRRPEDMPLAEIPDDADEKRIEKARSTRRKLLEKAMEKFCFQLEPLSAPDALLTEGDRVVGLRLRRTRVEGGRVIPGDETYERRGTCVISSIGSIPEPIPGIEMKGELFAFTDWDFGRLDGYPNVFSVGNVVTGKGNIVESRKHAGKVVEAAIESYLGLGEDGHAAETEVPNRAAEAAEEQAKRVADVIDRKEPAPLEEIARALEKTKAQQKAVGYDGDYAAWIDRKSPKALD
ncbi:MAG: FAD-dependent oxidoreductase [bacterium]|nr:FAD-dependent oxidoreductase [bacterium]